MKILDISHYSEYEIPLTACMMATNQSAEDYVQKIIKGYQSGITNEKLYACQLFTDLDELIWWAEDKEYYEIAHNAKEVKEAVLDRLRGVIL
jgi:hypothetical protein